MSVQVTIPVLEEFGSVDFVESGELWRMAARGGSIFSGTLLNRGIVRCNASDLGNPSSLVFPNDGAHTILIDLIYIPGYTPFYDRIYALFLNTGSFVIADVVPTTTPMTYTDVVTQSTTGTGSLLSGSICADANYLYVVRSIIGDTTSSVYRYALTTYAPSTPLSLPTGYRVPTNIRHSNGAIYAAGAALASDTNQSWIVKITANPFAVIANAAFTRDGSFNVSSSDLAITSAYTWMTMGGTAGRLRRTSLTDLSTGTVVETGVTAKIVSLQPEGPHVWALFYNQQAMRITSGGTQQLYTVPVEGTFPSGLISEGADLFLSNWGGARISRYRIRPTNRFHWVALPGRSAFEDSGAAVCTDALGNVYYAGQSRQAIFIAKYNSAGQEQWTKEYGNGFAHGIAVDTSGNVYVTGLYNGSASFGGPVHSGEGFSDMFILKVDSSGTYVWSKGYAGAEDGAGTAIAVDATHLYATGHFAGTINFGGGNRTAPGVSSIIVLKLALSDGAYAWDKVFSDDHNSNSTRGRGVALDGNGYCYVCGTFIGSITFGGQTIVTTVGSGFIVKLDVDDGADVWSKAIQGGAGSFNDTFAVAVFSNGDAGVIGRFHNYIDFGAGRVQSTGRSDIYIARFDADDGALVWAKTAGGSFGVDDLGQGIAIDSSDRMFCCGTVRGSADLGAGTMDAPTTSGWVGKFNPSTGNAIWSQAFGGNASTFANGVAIDPAGNPLTVGVSSATEMTYGGQTTYQGAGRGDGFLLKLSGG